MTAYTYHPMCEITHPVRRRHEVGSPLTSVTGFLQPSE
jgi:hypothetical protein